MIHFKNSTISDLSIIVSIAFAGLLFSLFLAKPKWDEINKSLRAEDNLWEAILIKKYDLTNNLKTFNPSSGEAKYVFRVTVPLIMKIFNLSPKQMYFLQWFLGFCTYLLWVKILQEFVQSKWSILLLTLSLSTVYYGKSFNIDSGTSVNSISYFLILFAIYFRKHQILYFLSLCLLFFNDERGILAFSIIGLFNVYFVSQTAYYKLISRENKILMIAFLICLGLRIFMSLFFQMKTPLGTIGFEIFRGQWPYLHIGIFSGIVGFIIPITLSISNEFSTKNYQFIVLILIVIGIFIVGTSIVSDMTKSIAYLIPLALLSFYRIQTSNFNLNKIGFSVLVVGIMFTTIVAVGDKQFYYPSYIFDIIFKIHTFF